ncbi:hypothetical protein A6V39_01130 [Candidatus Mycoplasma haematobovis]|uniref:Uncharacterized protein n=1 Tax=Candidatus Mycoplasma haematobovis TaxID=432608 RepID=A0A1A9QFD0_9MOLU|nr:hypothetical protein A6V39_01130 [Candidatus Mycoplasma haematobovis]
MVFIKRLNLNKKNKVKSISADTPKQKTIHNYSFGWSKVIGSNYRKWYCVDRKMKSFKQEHNAKEPAIPWKIEDWSNKKKLLSD